MKKKNVFMIITAIIGMIAGIYCILRAIDCLSDHEAIDDDNSFDEDMDFDLMDEYPEEAAYVPEEKTAPTKIRRGYIPIKLHQETANNA
ncbi:MAG: hypothetical protein PUH88_08710 [Lachnospiraceae bacterium]|nr:hypothetical protein [Lachnospiraceae bacterium]